MKQTSLVEGLRHLMDVLVEGYATLNRRVWVLLVPIGLDLFLWLGPHISPQRSVEGWTSTMSGMFQSDPSVGTQMSVVVTALQEWGQHFNLASLLSVPLLPVLMLLHSWGQTVNPTDLLAVPLIPALLPRLSSPAPPGFAPASWAPDAIWTVTLVPLVTLALGLLLWSFYLVPLADLVRGSNERGPAMLRRIPIIWWRMVKFLGLILVLTVLFALAVIVLATLGALFIPALGLLISLLSSVLVLWAIFYLFFAPDAILISWVQPWRAIMYSAQVVRSSLWTCLGFVLLIGVVQLGTLSLWQRLAGSPWMVLLGILANAYITGGLVAAGLVFYRERLRVLLRKMDKKEETWYNKNESSGG